MLKKALLSTFAIGITVCLALVAMDASAQQRGKNPIRVLGPDKNKDEVNRPASFVNQGRGIGCQPDFNQFVEGTVRLHGMVSEIDGDVFAIMDGVFVIDASEAEMITTPQAVRNGIGKRIRCATDGEGQNNGRGKKRGQPDSSGSEIEEVTEEIVAEEPIEEVILEVGSVVSVLGEFIEFDDGIRFVASSVRIMKMEPLCLDTNEGGICGIIDFVDIEQSVITIAGVSIMIDENTVIRTQDGLEAVQAGDFANVRIHTLDVDEDGVIDTLAADYLISFPLTVEP